MLLPPSACWSKRAQASDQPYPNGGAVCTVVRTDCCPPAVLAGVTLVVAVEIGHRGSTYVDLGRMLTHSSCPDTDPALVRGHERRAE